MTDERPPELDALGGSRPLPPDLRARLEAALLAGVDEAEVFAGATSPLDGPRPLPARLRGRLEAVLVAEGATSRRARRAGRPAPAEPATRRDRWWAETRHARLAATAAALLLVMGTTYFTSRATGPEVADRPPPASTGPDGPPPPFGLPFVADAASVTDDGAKTTTAPTVAGSPLTVAVIRGDPDQEAGFQAYVARLNREGGVAGRRLVVVDAGEPEAAGAVATVNLSDAAVAGTTGPPALAGDGPLLETMAVPEKVLARRVFGVASAPRRQAHVVVDALFPEPSPGTRAVVYQGGDGVWAREVPDAFVEALAARGVSATRIPVTPGRAPAFLPADVAFLSLDTAGAAEWLAAARRAGYAPPVAVAGIASLFEPSLLGALPDGAVVVSPYLPEGSPGETEELARRLGRAPGARAIHGWVTAKALAVALWQGEADSAAEAAAALADMDGWQDAFGPAWATRPGTRSRTPEGAVLTVDGGRFARVGDFRVDPF